VIIAMHHEQDIRKMGGLRKYLPITYWTALIGSLALIGFPGSSGFFSKDLIIEAVRESQWHGQGAVYWRAYLSVLLGVFVTALYSFRMFFLVFHGEERMDAETKSHLHETPWVVTVPLILLAIPSALIGWFTAGPVLFEGYFGDAIVVTHGHDVLAHIGSTAWHGSLALLEHSYQSPALWLAASGAFVAWFLYLRRPDIPAMIQSRMSGLHGLLVNKYYFDDLYIKGFAAWGRSFGSFLWKKGDQLLIDGVLVNGTARTVGKLAGVMRQLQTGYLYTYAFGMIIGLTALLSWLIWFRPGV
jgi:NADH-quinone oxidoreductase subunit L